MNKQLDLAVIAERFSRILRQNGVKLASQRTGLFVSSLAVVKPVVVSELYWCARVTLVSGQDEIPIFDRIFTNIFLTRKASDQLLDFDFGQIRTVNQNGIDQFADSVEKGNYDSEVTLERMFSGVTESNLGGKTSQDKTTSSFPLVANEFESLRKRNFLDISAEERNAVDFLLKKLPYMLPKRRSSRLSSSSSNGDRVDLRRSIREARRTNGDIRQLMHKRYKQKDRRVIALVDISGSMEPYRDFYLGFFHHFALAHSIEVFTLATRLSRVTKEISKIPQTAFFEAIGEMDLDWSSGTTIGKALSEFLNEYGRQGMSRGAVVLVVSDGWESGDGSLLSEQMRRMSLLAQKIIWVNPRSANPNYRPLTKGMQAALPFCDELVSGHNIESLVKLLEAISC